VSKFDQKWTVFVLEVVVILKFYKLTSLETIQKTLKAAKNFTKRLHRVDFSG